MSSRHHSRDLIPMLSRGLRSLIRPTRLSLYVYNILGIFLWPALLLYYLLHAHTDGKYRLSYRSRLGLQLPPHMRKSCRVWFHALSVGEAISIVPLVKSLKALFPEVEIVFSTKTEAGQAVARDRLSSWVNSFFFLPLDFPVVMDFLVKRLRPSIFVLVETDMWPNLLRSMEKSRVCMVIANGRISRRSFQRLRSLSVLLQPLLDVVEAVFAQTSEDKVRYEKLGIPSERIHAVGNLKFDSSDVPTPLPHIYRLREEAAIVSGRLVWICGSTHAGEEEIILEAHKALRINYPDLLLILAPRHTARAREIAGLCDHFGLSVATRSAQQPAHGKAVYILDTMGELGSFYELADVAFIGGSLIPFGGHNPLEAAAKMKPTLWGPYLSNFREIEKGLLDAECGQAVCSAHELEGTINNWLADASLRERMGDNARRFLLSRVGTGERIARFIGELLFPSQQSQRL